MNPTTAVLEKRVAEMEGGVGALALASGMAAITCVIQTIAGAVIILFPPAVYTAAHITCLPIRCRGSALRHAFSNTRVTRGSAH